MGGKETHDTNCKPDQPHQVEKRVGCVSHVCIKRGRLGTGLNKAWKLQET